MKPTNADSWASRNKTLNQEELKKFSLSKSLIHLMWKEPFYARILRSITKIESVEVPTAGVTCDNLELILLWNRRFFCSLPPKKVLGVLKHECLHILYDHIITRRKDPHIIWNYSADLSINSLIPENELPEGGLIPGVQLPELSDDVEESYREKYNKISKIIQGLPKNKTAEYYFDILNNNEDFRQFAKENESCINVFSFDDHESWSSSGSCLDGDEQNQDNNFSDALKAKINEIIKDAVNESNNTSWGTVPVSLRKELLKKYSRTISWQDILKRFCGYSLLGDRISSIKKLSRKYPGIHSGYKKDYKPKIAVYIDESGSMSDKVLSLLYSELEGLSKRTTFILYRFDTIVNEKSKLVWKKNKSIKLNRIRCGGTCFNSVTSHALKNKSEINGYIIMTDGCAPKPKPSVGLRRAWLLIPNTKLNFAKEKSDILITMDSNL